MAVASRIEALMQMFQGKGYGAVSLDAEVRSMLRFLPRSGSLILDVGGNKGDWTRALLSKADPCLERIFIFEPSKHHLSSLSMIPSTKVDIINAAVGNSERTADLFHEKEGSGLASLTKRRLDHFGIDVSASESVRVTTIDSFLSQRNIARVDFAKFDIEGHEWEAFQGARVAFENQSIKALSFEFGGANIDTRTYFQDFFYFLTGYGYKIERIRPFRRPEPIPVYAESQETFITTNYIAYVPK